MRILLLLYCICTVVDKLPQFVYLNKTQNTIQYRNTSTIKLSSGTLPKYVKIPQQTEQNKTNRKILIIYNKLKSNLYKYSTIYSIFLLLFPFFSFFLHCIYTLPPPLKKSNVPSWCYFSLLFVIRCFRFD